MRFHTLLLLARFQHILVGIGLLNLADIELLGSETIIKVDKIAHHLAVDINPRPIVTLGRGAISPKRFGGGVILFLDVSKKRPMTNSVMTIYSVHPAKLVICHRE